MRKKVDGTNKHDSSKPVLAIVSLSSGRHLPSPYRVTRILEKYGYSYDIKLITTPNEASETLQNSDLRQYRAVVVFGGDSTLAAAIKSLAETNIPIIILPGGSANLMAREFGIPKNIEATLAAFQANDYVLRYISLAEANGKPFVFDLHFGLFSVAVNHTPRIMKRWFGQQAYRITAFKSAFGAKKYTFKFSVDGKLIKRRGYACFVLASAGPWLLGQRLGPRPQAERLRVLLVRQINPFYVISWFILRLITGRELPNVVKTWQAKKISIHQAPVDMNFDDQPARADFPLKIKPGKKRSQVVIPRRKQGSFYNIRRMIRRNRYRYSDRIKRIFSGVPVEHYSRISEQLYLGGQYRARALSRFQNRNITGIVNMRTSSGEELPPGIEILHLPTVDHHAPTIKDLQAGVKFIKKHLKNKGGVYIHCHLGEGRGPSMAAAYLIADGMRPQDAIAHLQRYRPFARPNKVQRRRLREFAKSLEKKAKLNY